MNNRLKAHRNPNCLPIELPIIFIMDMHKKSIDIIIVIGINDGIIVGRFFS